MEEASIPTVAPRPCVVLVVEDDDDIRESLQQLLEIEGYRVATAANGREGLEALAREGPVSLVLLDLMMPVMNGWEFLAAQRELEREGAAHTPVVVVSAATGPAARPDGVDAFLRKPIELDRLLALVADHCPQAHS